MALDGIGMTDDTGKTGNDSNKGESTDAGGWLGNNVMVYLSFNLGTSLCS